MFHKLLSKQEKAILLVLAQAFPKSMDSEIVAERVNIIMRMPDDEFEIFEKTVKRELRDK